MLTPLKEFSISLSDSDYEARLSLAKTIARWVAFEIPPIHEGYDFSKPWTIAIRNILRTMKPASWRMIPPQDGSPAGEFLVDACWWAEGAGAALVAEFEWDSNKQEIGKDFEKLLVVKSPLKLMIFASTGASSSSKIEEVLAGYLSEYDHHIAGETYIFIDYWPGERVRAFSWQARSNGRLQVAFEHHFEPESFIRKWKPSDIIEP